MLKIYKSQDDGSIKELSLRQLEKGSWIKLTAPTQIELERIQERTNVEMNFLRAALDDDERSHTDIEDNALLILINVPVMKASDSYDTLPLGLVVTEDYLITICLHETPVLEDFQAKNAKLFQTFKKTRFLLQILYKSATFYLRYLRQISKTSDEIEQLLRTSMRNQDILRLLELQKGLTYFNVALRSDGAVLDKLMRLRRNKMQNPILKMYEEDEDLLEDVIIENNQAREMVEMYSQILPRLADTFSSIIANNLNLIMKFLAAMTIILAIPTVIASFFGMNVDIPLGSNPLAFLYISVLSCILAGASSYILWRHNMF